MPNTSAATRVMTLTATALLPVVLLALGTQCARYTKPKLPIHRESESEIDDV